MRNRHKPGHTWAIFVLLAFLAAPDRSHAQVPPETIPAVEVGDVVALTAGAVAALAPVDHPTLGRHIELGVKGEAQAVEEAFQALDQGLPELGVSFRTDIVQRRGI